MKHLLTILVHLLLMPVGLFAQAKPKPPAPPTSVEAKVNDKQEDKKDTPDLVLSPENEVKVLRLERKLSDLEARLQRAKADQAQAEKEEGDVQGELRKAFNDIAIEMKVDPNIYEADAMQNNFKRKKNAPIPVEQLKKMVEDEKKVDGAKPKK